MRQARILVIDDDLSICKGCQLTLSGKDRTVHICTTGSAGMKAVERNTYDLILLDMKLPDLEGMEILKAVREAKADTQVIVMTGYSSVQNAVDAMKSGAYDYLSKPFTDAALMRTVERAIEKSLLVEENRRLRKDLSKSAPFEGIVGDSPKILPIFDQVKRVAPTDATVLLFGESGTGKELFARAIHAYSPRSSRQFVAVDCSTLSPGVLESELFGHVKGSFTGATRDKAGIFEVAHGGTLFMDEVTNLNLDIQGKLLRVVEMGEFKPVGASHSRVTDVRIVAASNKEMRRMVQDGKFREDLFYRLNVFPIHIPPLRERKEDVSRLAYHFLKFYCLKTGKRIDGFSDEAMETLTNYEWPGNVRQLKNVVERLVILSDNSTIDLFYLLDHLQMNSLFWSNPIPQNLEELNAAKKHLLKDVFGQVQSAFLIQALKACNGNITRAAERVGMQRPNFCALLRSRRVSSELIKSELREKNSR